MQRWVVPLQTHYDHLVAALHAPLAWAMRVGLCAALTLCVWAPVVPQAREVDVHKLAPLVEVRRLPDTGAFLWSLGTRESVDTMDPSVRILMAEVKDALKARNLQGTTAGLGSLMVVYPDIGEPYRSVFANIIEGIEEVAKTRVRSLAVSPTTDPNELNNQLKQYGTKVVIALGQQGWRATANLDKDIAVVVGCVLKMPTGGNRATMGISLTPDPAQLFARLKSLQPTVKKIHVVYSAQANEWLMKLAREAARVQGLELIAHEARDMSSAVKLYTNVFSDAVSGRDAVWLPNDSTTVDENTILPLVLQESWARSVPIFSSNFAHVKKGALFALYPNNFELGRDLASVAAGALGSEPEKRGFSLLQAVSVAVNLRTASHVGISIASHQQRSFTSVFPER